VTRQRGGLCEVMVSSATKCELFFSGATIYAL
jgi:hypothetical protein